MGAFNGPRDWGRVLTAMLTPFTASGEVNLAETARIARFLVDEQANDGIVVNGTTGESPTLKEAEKLAVLDTVLEAVGDRAAVVFGAGTYDTAESIHMTKQATRAGAHGIMLVSPYYSRPGQDGLYAHFAEVASHTQLPVMLYNIQPRTSINIETPTMLRLASEVGNIVAVKEASGNMGQIQEVAAGAPEGFRVYSGDDGLTLPILAVGGYGIVSVAAHVVGKPIAEMVQAFPTDHAKALAVHQSLLPVYHALFSAPSPTPVKYALSLRGFECESVRLPLVPLNDSQKSVVDRALAGFS